MKLIFTTANLGNAFNALTSADRRYVPPQQRVDEAGLPQLMNAAVRFTIQLAIEAGEGARDLGKR